MDSTVTSTNTTDSGRIFITGQATGNIDTSKLIEAVYLQKSEPAVKIDETVERNVSKAERFTTLQTLSKALYDSVEGLASVNRTDETNLFDRKAGLVGSSSATPAESLVSIGIDENAPIGNYNIEVTQRAERMVVASTTETSADGALNFSRTITIGVQGGTTADVNITTDMSLNDIAEQVNATTSTTGITATVLEVGTGQFRLALTGPDESSIIEYTNANDILFVEQARQDAIIRFNGLTVTRPTNDFSDLIPGIDLQVENAEPGTNITLNVESDPVPIKEAIIAFVDAYNAYREFYTAELELGEVGTEEESFLFGDSTMRSLNNTIGRLLSSSYDSGDRTLNSIASIGISFNEFNQLEIDEAELDEALLDDFDGVRALFETQIDIDNNDAQILRNGYRGNDANIIIDIKVDGDGKIVSAGDPTLFEVRDSRIIGVEGGKFEGLTIAYIGGVDTTLNVAIQTGLGNELRNNIETFSDLDDGLIQNELSLLSTTNEALEEDADAIRERADRFREKEIRRYAEMEAAIAAAESVQSYLNVLLDIGE